MKIRRLKSKDIIAMFSQIVESNYQSLLQYAYFKCGNIDDAQDIVHDAFINTYKKLSSQTITNIKAYLFRSVYNLCIDNFRKTRQNIPLEVLRDNLDFHIKDCSFTISLREEFDRINQILISIPKEQQEVVRLKITEDLSFVDIAEILDIPASTVKSRYKYALEKIKNKYNKEVQHELH